ncbi:hypothetical protein B0H10DRAFT_2435354, partial [Mycena sp. CBHHK59/15]
MRVDNSHPSGYLTFTARMPLFKQSTHLQIAGGNFYNEHGNNLSPTHEDHALEDTADRPPSPDAPDWLAEVPVIYPRNSDSAQSASKNGASFRTEDAYTLENDFVGGGQIISIHSPDAASAWLDAHFNDSLLESMRSGGIGGPIAVMLSPDEPALAIFGNLLDEGVGTLAQLLSEASNFTVIARPIMDDPIPKFIKATAEQARPRSGHLPAKRPDDSGDPVVEHRQGGNNAETGTRKAVRIRGGVGSEEDLTGGKKRKGGRARPMPEWDGDYHSTMVDLMLQMGQNTTYNVRIRTSIQFKTQSRVPRAGESWRPRPEVISSVLLELKLKRNETMLDHSHSSIGFLVHRADSIFKCDFVDCGNGPPDVKQKHTRQKASQEMLGVTVGLDGGKPTMSANASFTRGASETLESADEKPIPKCDMRWDVGTPWQGPEKDYDCYDVSWWPASDRHGIANEMRVDFGLAMNIVSNKLYTPGLPQISSILRNQIMVWVSDPTSPAKGRGILVLTSLYIPNIQTNDALTIHEKISADLANHSNWLDGKSCSHVLFHSTQSHTRSRIRLTIDPPTAFKNPTAHNAAMSVSVAALHKPDTRKTLGVLHKLRKLVKLPSSSGSKGKTVQQLPL